MQAHALISAVKNDVIVIVRLGMRTHTSCSLNGAGN